MSEVMNGNNVAVTVMLKSNSGFFMMSLIVQRIEVTVVCTAGVHCGLVILEIAIPVLTHLASVRAAYCYTL